MGDFALDTELVEVAPGRYERTLSREWEIWGPNGGYLAAIAMRAAQTQCQRARPANASIHFLSVASFEQPVVIAAHTLRSSRNASSVNVAITQNDKPILSGMFWAVDDGLAGLEHDDHPMPDVDHWSQRPTMQQLMDGKPASPYAFWNNFEQRPATFIDDWENRQLGAPLWQQWMKFVPTARAASRWEMAARLLLLVDLGGWPSIGRRHFNTEWIAPSIDVSCEFHRLDLDDEWLLCQGESPFAGEGLIGTHQQIWNDRGQLVASGISHLLSRRIRPS